MKDKKENIVMKENVLNDETFEAMKETELLKKLFKSQKCLHRCR
jgi:hypothetical protein